MLIAKKTDGMKREDLVEFVGKDLQDTCYKELEARDEWNRQSQIAFARRNTLYMDGKQYLAPTISRDGRIFDWQQVDVDKSNKKPKFANTFNIVYADGIKFVAVVSQRQLNMRCVPNDPMDQSEVISCREGNAAIQHLHRHWKLQRQSFDIAFNLWSTSAVYLHTRYATDSRRFGTVEVPRYEYREEMLIPAGFRCSNCGNVAMAEICPACTMPLNPLNYQDEVRVEVPYEDGVKSFAKGNVDLKILTCLDVSHSFSACSVQEMDWIDYSTMEPKYRLKSIYNIEGEGYEEDTDRLSWMDAEYAKGAIESPTGSLPYDPRTDRWRHSQRWIRPEVYNAFSLSQRNALRKMNPDGSRIVSIGERIIQIDHEKLDDYWAVIKTGTGPRISSPALCHHIIPEQDSINNFFNLGEETLLRAIPKTFVDAALVDPEVMKDTEAIVSELIRVKMRTGEKISDMIGALPVARMQDQTMPFAEMMRTYARDTDGVQPAIFGGGEAAPTFRQEQQRKNQALMQFAPVFTNMQNGVVDATRNGLRELAKYGVGTERIPSNNPMVPATTLTIGNLREGGYEVEADESWPQSIPEKQEHISKMSQENPIMAGALGWVDPMNIAEINSIFGMDGMFVQGDAERNRAMTKIQKLLSEQPIQEPDMMTGGVIEMSSMPADEFELKNPVFFAQIFYAWCVGEAGVQLQETNPDGFQNVMLHWKEIDQAAQMQMLPPPVEGEEGEPPAGEPPSDPGAPPEQVLQPIEG